MSPQRKQLPVAPNFHFEAFQSRQNVPTPLIYGHQPHSTAARNFESESSIRPYASMTLPGESFGVFAPVLPIRDHTRRKENADMSSDSNSCSHRREKMGDSVESLISQLSSESHRRPPNFTSPIVSEASVQKPKKRGGIINSKKSTPVSVQEDTSSSTFDPRHKQRAQGFERFEEITDKERRKVSQSKQIKQVKMDLARLLLTTGCHSCLLIVPPSWKVHKYATAGDFNSFLQMYTSALEAQRKLKRRETKLRIDEVWERFHGRSGLHHTEALCAALLESGCDDTVVENFKDAYLSSLAGEQTQMIEARKKLSSCLNDALRAFIALEMSD